ncbi:MAG TPA: secondary thiamine-phosphate synthase enzyme YjbQ [Vicinamibacteria bacterium]
MAGTWVELAAAVHQDALTVATGARVEITDLTEELDAAVRRSGIRDGLAFLQTLHTTTALVVNENEPLLREDLGPLLERLAPAGAHYAHNELHRRPGIAADESPNGDSHCRALLLGHQATLAVAEGRLRLGRWQRVMFVELDGPRERSLTIVVMGTREERRP